MNAYVAYYRVSTQKQGTSGLGLAAQRAAVAGYTVVAEYTEVESGKHADRPQLALAIEHAERIGATLVVAKFDRLARNVHFLSGLMRSGVKFIAADMPEANKLTIHVLAAVAEHEAEMTSIRTKAALQAAKARGVKLGRKSPATFADGVQAQGRSTAAVTVSARVAAYAATVLPHVQALKDQGLSLNAIAKALTVHGVATPNGGNTWQHGQVSRVLARVA